MARITDNFVTKGTSGAVGKELVFRIKNKKSFVGKYPDMSKVIPSKNQTNSRKIFADAIKFAQSVMNDPEKQKEFKIAQGKTLYHSAIKDYMNRFNQKKSPWFSLPVETIEALQSFPLTEEQLRAVVFISEYKKISNSNYQKMNGVSKPTASRHLRELATLNIIKSNKGKGAGAFYTLGDWWQKIGSSDEIIGSSGK